MRRPYEPRPFSMRALPAVAGLLTLTLLMAAVPASADRNGRSHHRRDRHSYYAPPPRPYYAPPRAYYAPPRTYYAPPPVYFAPPPPRPRFYRPVVFVAPQVIYQVETYQPYYYGRAYYPAHHHHHDVYRFPVERGGLMSYQPYYYCGKGLFFNGRLSNYGGHIGLRINF